MKKFLSSMMIAIALFALAGCGGKDNPASPVDPAGAQALADAGDAALASGDIAGANASYKAALAKDPSNAQANFGAAVTEVYLLQSDPDIAALLDQIGPLARSTPIETEQMARTRRVLGRLGANGQQFDALSNMRLVGRILLEGAEDPPAISQIQTLIKVKVLPKLAYAEARLNVIETNTGFAHRIPPAVSGEPDTVEIDLGEIFALDVVINSVQGALGVLVAYNFDVPYEGANAESLLAEGTAFGRLHTDGATQLSSSRANLLVAKIRLDQMVAFINGETDDQSDDVIPDVALTDPGFQEFWSTYDYLNAALSQQVGLDVQAYDGTPVSIFIDLGKFFTNPIQDWKTKLPAHSFDVNHEPVIENPILFPDPSLNGIFPKMTNELWQSIIGPVGPPPPA